MGHELVNGDDIEAAARVLDGVIRRTPTVRSDSLSRHVGRPVWLKHEEQQRTGSFKFRGAFTMLSDALATGELGAGGHVVAASAGNHAQGVALAAERLGLRSTIFMPKDASLPKLAATEDYGAEVQLIGTVVDECLDAARAYAAEHGALWVPPFDDRRILAGQGTIGLEVLDAVPDVEAVVIAIGGGGLCSGISAAVKSRAPEVATIGVVAEGAASMAESINAGSPVSVTPMTMADGIAIGSPSELTLAHVRAFVDDIVAVSDDAIALALLLALERVKATLEPAGAASLAAVLEGLVPGEGPVVAILSGGNIDPLLLGRIVEHGLTAMGRFLRLRIVLSDRPGALSDLTEAVAHLGLNIVDVEHHRRGLNLPVGGVEVGLIVETRDRHHQQSVMNALGGMGYDVHLVA